MPSIDDVHREFGSASETAQLLETELGTLLFEKQGEALDLLDGTRSEDAQVLMASVNRSTLGQLIFKLQEVAGDQFAHASEQLAKALAARNRLVHSFFLKHNFRRNTSKGCAIMLADLEKIHEAVLVAYKLMLKISGFDLDAMGLPPALPTTHLKLEMAASPRRAAQHTKSKGVRSRGSRSRRADVRTRAYR